MDKMNEQGLVQFKQEAELMSTLKPHPNLVTYYGICINPSYPICIVIEFLPNG